MTSNDKKALNALEAELIASKGLRHPFVSFGDQLPMVLFITSFVVAMVAISAPSWLSVGILPALIFAAAWYVTRNAKEEFYQSLKGEGSEQ